MGAYEAYVIGVLGVARVEGWETTTSATRGPVGSCKGHYLSLFTICI
jgi:hypothetical protein